MLGHPGGRVEASCASIDLEILELSTRKCGVWFLKSFIRRGGSTCSNSTCYIIYIIDMICVYFGQGCFKRPFVVKE